MHVFRQTSESPLSKGNTSREEYGDWQTGYEFARNVCLYLKGRGVAPEVIVEPTCGVGNFIAAAIDVFDTVKKVYGVEISKGYMDQTEQKLRKYQNGNRIVSHKLYNTNVFTFDFGEIVRENQQASILILGTPLGDKQRSGENRRNEFAGKRQHRPNQGDRSDHGKG